MQGFIVWLLWIAVGLGVIYGLCGLTEKFDFITNWPSFTKGIFIIASLGWIFAITKIALGPPNKD